MKENKQRNGQLKHLVGGIIALAAGLLTIAAIPIRFGLDPATLIWLLGFAPVLAGVAAIRAYKQERPLDDLLDDDYDFYGDDDLELEAVDDDDADDEDDGADNDFDFIDEILPLHIFDSSEKKCTTFDFESTAEMEAFVDDLLRCGANDYPKPGHTFLLKAIIHYVWKEMPRYERNFDSVIRLLNELIKHADSTETLPLWEFMIRELDCTHQSVIWHNQYKDWMALYSDNCNLKKLHVLHSCRARVLPHWYGFVFQQNKKTRRWTWKSKHSNFFISSLCRSMHDSMLIRDVLDSMYDIEDKLAELSPQQPKQEVESV